MLLLTTNPEAHAVSDHEPDRLPHGHVERQRVSNEVLAFQLTTLQEAQTSQNALLRDQIREGFGEIKQTLNKHTEQISEIKIDMASWAARTAALEQFRAEIEDRERETAKQTVLELQTASAGADDARTFRILAGVAVTVLTLAIGVLTIIVALHHGG